MRLVLYLALFAAAAPLLAAAFWALDAAAPYYIGKLAAAVSMWALQMFLIAGYIGCLVLFIIRQTRRLIGE